LIPSPWRTPGQRRGELIEGEGRSSSRWAGWSRTAACGTAGHGRRWPWWTFHGPAVGLRWPRRFGAAPDV